MRRRFKKRINTIGVKVTMLYIVLAIVNISIFTILIFENQIDLIVDNTRLNAKELVTTIVSSLKKFSAEISTSSIFRAQSVKERIGEADSVIRPLVRDYLFFSESGKIILLSYPGLDVPDSYVEDGLKAIANKDFSGRDFYLKIMEDTRDLYFYLPLHEYQLGDTILFLRYHMKDIGERLSDLYTLITVIIIAISIFHALFAVILYRMIIRPIHILYQGSGQIAVGNFDVRVDIDHRDELGALGESFNIMAESVQEKVDTLEDQMKIISEAKEKIEQMAITDDLTGLYNRRYLFEQLEREIERSLRYGSPLGFIMVDADHFKSINDTYGHHIGDIVLKEIAALIRENCREIDTAARYGGEEFAVIALSADTETTFVMAERIRKSVEAKPIRCDDVEINLTVSIGLISYRQEELEKMAHPDDMVNAADRALYRAKQNGRNRTEIYSDDETAQDV